MKTIVISGIDGSGKTSVITDLQKSLEVQGASTAYIWLRFNHYFAKILHAIARLTGLSEKTQRADGIKWEHRFYKSRFFCFLYIRATYLDSIIGKRKFRKHTSSNPDYVICDRWIPDVLIDLTVKTHDDQFLNSKWAKRFLNLMPKDALLFIIFRNKADILSCRDENQSDPDFNFRHSMYESLAQFNNVNTIDNSGSISQSVNQVLAIIK